ncbi:hypothetical protein BGW39_003396 [Mortierella sp. 14UC]|nr:hypothetical protein BGW39_003396 [Mortierella sp. 14UC]
MKGTTLDNYNDYEPTEIIPINDARDEADAQDRTPPTLSTLLADVPIPISAKVAPGFLRHYAGRSVRGDYKSSILDEEPKVHCGEEIFGIKAQRGRVYAKLDQLYTVEVWLIRHAGKHDHVVPFFGTLSYPGYLCMRLGWQESGQCETKGYQAPELRDRKAYDTKADMFPLRIILRQLLDNAVSEDGQQLEE